MLSTQVGYVHGKCFSLIKCFEKSGELFKKALNLDTSLYVKYPQWIMDLPDIIASVLLLQFERGANVDEIDLSRNIIPSVETLRSQLSAGLAVWGPFLRKCYLPLADKTICEW